MKSVVIVLVVLLLLGLLIGGKFVSTRNELVTIQESKTASW